MKISSSISSIRCIKHLGLVAVLAATASVHASIPPNAVVDLPFSEGPGFGSGVITTNLGALDGFGTFYDLQATNVFPAFSTNLPSGEYVPAGNSFALDFGTFTAGSGGRAVDFTTEASPPGNGTMGQLPKVTICGWANVRAISSRGQIAYALETAGGLGFSLAINAIGQMGLGINQNAANAPASKYQFVASSGAPSNNWVFFAATYDPALTNQQLKYFVGRPYKLAALDSAFDYVGGDLVSSNVDYTGTLSVGNQSIADAANRDTESNAGNALFRGLIDELKIYTNALTLDEIQQAQISSAVTPVAPTILTQPSNKSSPEGQNAQFDVDVSASGLVTYQWKTNGVNVPGATNSSFILDNVTLNQSGLQVRVGVTNSVSGLLSSNATLVVVPANPHLVSLSFVEATSRTTNYTITATSQDTTGGIHTGNVGAFGGGSRFRQQSSSGNLAGTWPVFTANVPSGPFAPSPTYNRYALHMGDVLVFDTTPGSQGNRWLDFTNTIATPVNTLGEITAFTICGWLNSGNLSFRGTVGNQIVCALDATRANGFGLAHKSDNSLQLVVNEGPSGSTANRSTVSKIPTGDTNHPPASWVFFAVTYNGAASVQNLAYYFGDPNNQATNDVTLDYARGIVTNTSQFTVGNYNPDNSGQGRTINGANAAFWRGVIDELHVFSRVLTLAEIRQMQVAPAIPSVLLLSTETNNAVLSWEGGTAPLVPDIQLQSRTNLSVGTWTDVPNATNVSGSIRSLGLPLSGEAKYFRLRTK